MEPEHVLAGSMVSLLLIGMLAQLLRSYGGAVARAAPFLILVLMVAVAFVTMASLQQLLSTAIEWEPANELTR